MILEKFGDVAQLQIYDFLKIQQKFYKSRVLLSKLDKKKKNYINLKKKVLLPPGLN